MIFKKGNMWKVAVSSANYVTEEEELKAARIHQAVMKASPVEKTYWAPVEKTDEDPIEWEDCESDHCGV